MMALPKLLFLLFSASVIRAADFYADPQNGRSDNDGSAARPWQSLQRLIDSKMVESQTWESLPFQEGARLVPLHPGAKIKAGDTIWLRSGSYGTLQIENHYNGGLITIAAEKGHTPRFNSIRIRSGSHWKLQELHVAPASADSRKKTTLIALESHGWRGPVSDIIVENCTLSSIEDSSQWSAQDWNTLACNGIRADGTRMTIRGNRLKNVNFGIDVSASRSLIEDNTVENFAGDGLRGLGDYSVFQYNLVKNCYDVNENHDDGFQSWSTGEKGVGTGEVVGIVLRGNTIINYEEPDQPHRGPLQGIGCFDGMYRDWIIENNLIVVDHWHGITLMGAENCRIINNTVVDCNDDRPGPPAIRTTAHKKGTPAKGCVIRNNIATAISADKGSDMTADHNLIVKDLKSVFADPAKKDFRLTQASPAIDAGSAEAAPENDILRAKRPQGRSVDIGAYEY